MISHKNIISNTLQLSTSESNFKSGKPEALLAVLPMSHSYALIVTGHAGVYRGYTAVVLPGFDLIDVLEAVQKHYIETLWMVRNVPSTPQFTCDKRILLAGTDTWVKRFLP
jgi:acyl-CoA synthetase (AMP-forming)/AMP-acid ligase II